ncbi:MAG: helix-turn-helix domain-containing protein [Clostridia bacterium]|nr:helix-turn-helix domain-containing protein [Clostridia bacterium]
MITPITLKLPFESPMDDIMFHIHHNAYPIQHCHDDFWEFMFVSEGELLHKINGQTRKLTQNMLCIIRPNDCHTITQPKDTSSVHYNLAIRSPRLIELLKIFPLDLFELLNENKALEYQILPQNTTHIVRSAESIMSSDRSMKISMMTLYFFTIVQEIVSHMAATKGIRQQYSNCTNQLIQLLNNPANLAYGLAHLVSMTGYSYSHLNRTFTRETGNTPSHYLKQKKLKYAQELIQYTDTSLNDIAYKIGYSSYSHFSDFFKDMTGDTPVVWGKKNQSALLKNTFATNLTFPHL